MAVRETLDFSGQCQGVGSRYNLLQELMRREKEEGIKPDPDVDVFMKEKAIEGQKTSLMTDYVLKLLGLEICADTLIGNQMIRGVSGGQKKRVTTGEMLVGRPKALFMDEISTGLDSSTTFQIIKCLRQIVHVLNGTMLIALLQPAPETYEQFDDILLLSEGEIVYQGPREYVLDFFESMGFKCPDRKGAADFLQEVTSIKDQEQYWVARNRPYRYIPVKEFAEAFRLFHVGKRLTEELSHSYDTTKSHPAALTSTSYGVNRMNMLKACFSREVLLMKRNSFVYIFKTVQITVIGTITMTLFFRMEMHHRNITDGNLYMGALFFGLVHMMFNGFPEMSMMVVRLPVFYKQRDLLFYPAWAYALPTWIVKIPISFLEAFIWVSVTYYVTGFAPEAERCNQQLIKELSTPAPGSEDLNFPTQYAHSFGVQCMACLWKQYWSYWRNPHYVVVRFFYTTMVALLFGSIYWDLGTRRGNQQDLFNILGVMYSSVIFLGVSNASNVQPVINVERTVFYRERAAGMYSAFPYAFGQVAIECPYVLVQSVAYALLVYSMIAFEWTAVKFFWFLFFMYFTFLYFTFFGMLTVAITPNFHVAAITASAFYSTWNFFCGFIIPRPRMPVWWRWYTWVTPVSWTFYGLVASQLADVDTEMETADGKVVVSEFIKNYFGIRRDFVGIVALVIVCIPIGFASLFDLAIKKLNFQRR